jgi:SAM-dependent methyltransferase
MGYGRNALWLVEQGYQVEGWEEDARYLREARREARRRGVRLICRQRDFTRVRLQGSYDVIVISQALHHVRRSAGLRVLRAAGQALAPGGKLFLLVKLTDDRYFRRVSKDPNWERVPGERNTFRRVRAPGEAKYWPRPASKRGTSRRRRRRWVLSALAAAEVKAAVRGLRIRHYRERVLRSDWEEAGPVTHQVAEVVAERAEGESRKGKTKTRRAARPGGRRVRGGRPRGRQVKRRR